MTVETITMHHARCDAPGCKMLSSDYENGNHQVYDTVDQLTQQFMDTREGSLSDDYGWLRVPANEHDGPDAVDRHYCGEHTTWDENFDQRVPALDAAVTADVALTTTI
ncbi:hypothetical protein [Cryobacterium zhongshanensis]|uniref:Uncharacterized protein n=1 Tax=Cryobacterium zhongshanensis TaxID=2928153 RepID=A0AA41QXR7_9MICO|nr:hypothetical protein [Cryobacterium zhongshanensis]MCI4659606.1 hypothetical protein [Cryobacterium zhongshanensis]